MLPGSLTQWMSFVVSTWELGIDRDTWDMRILDAGYSVKQLRTPEGGGPLQLKPVVIKDIHGDPITEPTPLNGQGQRLDPEDDPVFLRFVPRLADIADKVLWGTDWPSPGVVSPRKNIDEFLSLGLGEEVERKIFWENASRLF